MLCMIYPSLFYFPIYPFNFLIPPCLIPFSHSLPSLFLIVPFLTLIIPHCPIPYPNYSSLSCSLPSLFLNVPFLTLIILYCPIPYPYYPSLFHFSFFFASFNIPHCPMYHCPIPQIPLHHSHFLTTHSSLIGPFPIPH